MNTIDTLIDTLTQLNAEKKELEDQIKTVRKGLVSALAEAGEDKHVAESGASASVSVRRTFNAARAVALVDDDKICSPYLRRKITTRQPDRKLMEMFAPELFEAACVESAPTVVVREAK